MRSTTENIPEVGKGATIYVGSDRWTYEVKAVSEDKKTAILLRCIPKIISGDEQCGNAVYDLSLTGKKETTLKFKRKFWYLIPLDTPHEKISVRFGIKIQFMDPCF